MSVQRFFTLLIVTIICSSLAMGGVSLHDSMATYLDIGWYATAIFALLSVIVFFVSRKMEASASKVIFINIILVNMLLKMVFSGLIAFVYYMLRQPEDGLFIVPFIIVYVVFTVFETYFMNEQARAR